MQMNTRCVASLLKERKAWAKEKAHFKATTSFISNICTLIEFLNFHVKGYISNN